MNSVQMLIMHHEGKTDSVYRDSVGVLTCGIGHALHVGSKVPEKAIYAFFEQDIEDAIRLYYELELNLDEVRRAAVIDMCFNLGPQLKRWRFVERMREHNWKEAAKELKNSKWWSQVRERAKEIRDMVLTGEWPKIK